MSAVPAVPEIERDLLGHCIFEGTAYLEAEQILSASDFANASHQVIFIAIASMIASGRPVNLRTLVEHLRERRELEGVGGAAYVASLTEGIVRFGGEARDYATRVAHKARLRQFIEVTYRASQEASNPGAQIDELVSKTEEALLNIRAASQPSGPNAGSKLSELLARMHQERTRKSDLLGLPTGLDSMDELTRGLQPGEITVVGSRSGVGKSCLMCQAAAANCRKGIPVLLFSLEMSRQQLQRRLLAEDSGVPYPWVADPKWATDSEMGDIGRSADRLDEWPLQIIDESGLTIEKLTAIARLAVRRDGVKLVAVDYCQIVSAQGRDERLRVAAVSRGLTRLAKDEGIPVLVLSQLARADRHEPNRRPVMSDLRESSQLENDAHVIALIHREWNHDENRLASDGELIIAKQRSGETGVLPITFNRGSLTFEIR